MPIKVKFEVESRELSRLIRRLARLDKKAARKYLRKAVTVAGRFIRDLAKSFVAVRTGQLKKSLGVKVKAYPKRQTYVAIVGPRRDFVKDFKGKNGVGKVDPVNYAHLVEYGRKGAKAGVKSRRGQIVGYTKARFLSDGTHFYGKEVKPAAPRPFMRPALDQGGDEAIRIMIDIVKEGIEKARG
jgi:HK97 gp10 family phage protein